MTTGRRHRAAATGASVRAMARRAAAEVARWDDLAFRRLATVENVVLDRATPVVTRLSDHSGVWVLVAAGMAATRRPPAVRSAAHGLVTIAVTSLLANQGLKRVIVRRRPPRQLVPATRRAPAKSSSSFPSGHTASAIAFLVVVARRRRRSTAPLAASATVVGLARVSTGLHYPSDVLAGAVIGAVIGTASRRMWPGSAW
ncbi:phosphatase PAP2 family protein [Nakamurella deserti]|uniref:phosphatase PAP2 family protein n=1 Tax=Nakamurella deserti TaxID=2164074 RepID=UPI000DBE1EFB|nr:phosphatase PAP2 family protein [Nakamurella deserti]